VSGRLTGGRNVAVVGYAHSPAVRHADVALGALCVDTARAAIADAGLEVSDIDGFVGSSLLPSGGAHVAEDGVSIVTPNWLAASLGVDPAYAAGFQGYGALPGSVTMGINALAAGSCDYVLVHRALFNPPGRYHENPMTEAAGSQQWTVPQGYFGPVVMIAMLYNEYVQRYGATREAMAKLVVEARRQGSKIPWSYWYNKPLSEDEYLTAPMINDPICRFDCDIPVDGVATFVLTTAERARDLPHKPVHVAGYAFGAPTRARLPLHWPLDDVMEVGKALASRLWGSAGLTVGDVDLPQLYDGFSPFLYLWMEVLGLCAPGEAHQLALEGRLEADRPDGIPILSGGGAIGNGRMHGVPQMLECYLQLSGRAADRQRPASVGVACHSSPHFGGAIVYTAEPT
jgi:acetyl-CoA acetyltransferase